MLVLTEDMAVAAVNEVLLSKRERSSVIDSSTVLDDLGLDSLDVAELFATLEDLSGLDLDPGSADSLRTVGDLATIRAL
jgi:acyl carrier protein